MLAVHNTFICTISNYTYVLIFVKFLLIEFVRLPFEIVTKANNETSHGLTFFNVAIFILDMLKKLVS